MSAFAGGDSIKLPWGMPNSGRGWHIRTTTTDGPKKEGVRRRPVTGVLMLPQAILLR